MTNRFLVPSRVTGSRAELCGRSGKAAARIAAVALVWIAAASGLFAQDSPAAAKVRGLNNALLRLQSRLHSDGPGGAAGNRAQAAGVIAQRQAALAALIEEDAKKGLALGFSADLVERLKKDFPGDAAQLESHGSWVGVYEAEVIDGEAFASSREVRRLRTGNGSKSIRFADDRGIALAGGDTVRIDGMMAGDSIAATGGETVAAAAGQSCSTLGNQRIAVIKVTFPTFASNPPSYPNATLHDYMFGSTGRTVNNYWKDASYNQAWATGDVYPAGSDAWYMLDREYSCASNNDESTLLRQAAINAANADIDFNNYERIVVVFPKPLSGCAYAGLGSIGCWLSAPDGSPSISYALQRLDQMANRNNTVMLTTHEGGHNLGLHHGSSLDFGSEALGPLAASGTRGEYGDTFTTMGSWNLGHYAAEHKKTLGWLTASQTLAVNSSGSFSIEPMSGTPAGGRKALEVNRGTGNSQKVWIEFRQPVGDYDSQLGSQVYTGALMHYNNFQGGGRTQLLDFTTGTSSFNDPALASGQSWSDPYSNLSIDVGAASSSSLGVTINFGAPPCTPANPSITLTPPNPTVSAGASAVYNVVVTNNDASGCASSTFNLSSSAPAGWSSSFQPTTLTIAPGANAAASMTKTPLATPDPGTYPVNATAAKATNPSSSATASANVTVSGTPNTPPVANPQSVSTNEDSSLPVTLTGSDADLDPLTFAIVSGPSNGSLSGSAPNVTYTPNANYFGSDSFTFKANDGTADSSPASISITVNAVNDAPSFTKGSNQTVAQNAGAQTVVAWATAISAGPPNESGQTVSFVIASNSNPGIFSAAPAVAPNGALTFTPGNLGSSNIGVRAMDTGGTANGGVNQSPIQTFSITITDPPPPPPPMVDNLAIADFANAWGTVSGTYTNTHTSNNVYQTLREEQQGGNAKKARSLLEHTWTFDVAPGATYQFRVEAYHTLNGEGDDFVFSYSTDNSSYSPMLTVTKNADNNAAQTFEFPGDVSGTLYVRVQDTDSSQGNNSLDSLYVDFMAVRTATGGIDIFPPVAPTGLGATPGNATVSLDWADNDESDLDGYNIYRSTTSGGPYTTKLNGALLGPSAYVDNSALNGTTYYYVVTAVDTTGNESAKSAQVLATPNAPGTASSLHVQSVSTTTVSIGQGSKIGRADVLVLNNLGDPVSGVTVNGIFSGSINEAASGQTGGNGSVTLQTNGSAKGGVSVSFCVSSVTGGLPYVPGDNGPGVGTCQ